MEEQELLVPNIVEPYKEAGNFEDETYFLDLGLESMLADVPFGTKSGGRDLAKHILLHLKTDKQTIEYRQQILEELINNEVLRKKVREIQEKLSTIDYKLWGVGITEGIKAFKMYKELIEKCPGELEGAKSEGIQEVKKYLERIKESATYRGICEFLKEIESVKGVEFKVTLDDDGEPERLYAMKLVKDEASQRKFSFFERITGKKEELKEGDMKNLKDGLFGTANALGKEIKGYLNEVYLSTILELVGQVRETTELIPQLDLYTSMAEYYVDLKERGIEITKPKIKDIEKREMEVNGARNPLVRNEKIVPNDIKYNGDENFFIITGPNNGGKTTYIKTVGLIQALAQAGFFVPAQYAEVSLVDGIYTHFVSPDDITKREGRYKNELRRMKDILTRATTYSLVILDEPCGGTSYGEGLRKTREILDGLYENGATVYFTTHMHPLTEEVERGRYPDATNLQVELKEENGKHIYTYKLIPGASGKSYGEEIAKEVGLTREDIMRIIEPKRYRTIVE